MQSENIYVILQAEKLFFESPENSDSFRITKRMKKHIHTIYTVMLLAASGFTDLNASGNQNCKALEAEIGAGFSMAHEAKPGLHVLAEIRWNLPAVQFDLGLQAANGGIFFKERHEDVKFNLVASVFADYNFKTSGKLTPFAGLGAGYFIADSARLLQNATSSAIIHGTAITPRIGIELLHHLRITAHYRVTLRKDMSHLGISLGWSFGGGPRR